VRPSLAVTWVWAAYFHFSSRTPTSSRASITLWELIWEVMFFQKLGGRKGLILTFLDFHCIFPQCHYPSFPGRVVERTEQTQQFIKYASFWSWATNLERICGYWLQLCNLVSFIYVITWGVCFGYCLLFRGRSIVLVLQERGWAGYEISWSLLEDLKSFSFFYFWLQDPFTILCILFYGWFYEGFNTNHLSQVSCSLIKIDWSQRKLAQMVLKLWH